MASRDIVVTVREEDWLALSRAADCAGMSVQAYICWGVRLLALHDAPPRRGGDVRPASSRRSGGGVHLEESESAAWLDSFEQRLSGHADRGSAGAEYGVS